MMNLVDSAAKTKIWVISLTKATERRAAFKATLEGSSLDWDFYDAHTGVSPDLTYSEKTSTRLNGRPMQRGELGCYSSHHQLWKWLIDSQDYDQMLVIEDDVHMDWSYVRDIKGTDFSKLGIEYLRLFAKMPAAWRFIASPFLDKYRHLVQFTGYPLGTQVYMVTKSGARKFAANARNLEAPIDVYMDRTWEHGVLNLAIFPFPAFERHQASSIGEERFTQISRPLHEKIRGVPPRVCRRLQSLWLQWGFSGRQARKLKKSLKAIRP